MSATLTCRSQPGGVELIMEHAGKDVTFALLASLDLLVHKLMLALYNSALFNNLHQKGTLQKIRSQITPVGILDPTSVLEAVGLDDGGIEERRSELPPPEYVLNLGEFETFTKQILTEDSRQWRYFSSWADDGASESLCFWPPLIAFSGYSPTLRALAGYYAAASSFSFLRFIPRVNVPVAEIDSTTTFFSHTVPIPIFFAPTGQGRNGHPDGELNLTRAGSRTGIPQGVSSGSSFSINEILHERDELVKQGRGRTPVWWQLCEYPGRVGWARCSLIFDIRLPADIHSDREETADRIRNAVRNGSDAILITVDVPALGKRETDSRVLPSSSGGSTKKDGGLASTTASLLDGEHIDFALELIQY